MVEVCGDICHELLMAYIKSGLLARLTSLIG